MTPPPSSRAQSEWLYKGTMDCFTKIIKDEGTSAMFKGAGANALRTVGAALVLVFYRCVSARALRRFCSRRRRPPLPPPPYPPLTTARSRARRASTSVSYFAVAAAAAALGPHRLTFSHPNPFSLPLSLAGSGGGE